MFIDRVFSTVQSELNTAGRGNFTPARFDLFCFKAMNDIIEDYLEEINKMVNRENRGLINGGLENIPDRIRDKIARYYATATLTYSGGSESFLLPDGLRYFDTVFYNDTVEVDRARNAKEFNIIRNQPLTTPDATAPIYMRQGNVIKVLPTTIIANVSMYYLRNPYFPRWTYNIVGGNEIFNPSSPDFQDIDLDESDESKLVDRILYYFALELKELELAGMTQNKEQIESNENMQS